MQDYYFILLLQEDVLKKAQLSKANTYNVSKIAGMIGLSESTLQRFFGLTPYNNKLTPDTLNILSKFAGYSDWDIFKTKKKNKINPPQSLQTDSPTLFELCLKNGHWDTVIEYINNLPVPDDKIPTPEINVNKVLHDNHLACMLGKYIYMCKNKKVADKVLSKLAKSKAGQFYFYETVVNDHPWYLDAIEKYYLKSIYTKAPFGTRDTCFAYAMLYNKYLQYSKKKELSKIGAEWFNYEVKPEQATKEEVSILPHIRYHTHHFSFLKLSDKETNENILAEIADLMKDEDVLGDIPVFIYATQILFNSLYLSGFYNIIIDFFENSHLEKYISEQALPLLEKMVKQENNAHHLLKGYLLEIIYYTIESYKKLKQEEKARDLATKYGNDSLLTTQDNTQSRFWVKNINKYSKSINGLKLS